MMDSKLLFGLSLVVTAVASLALVPGCASSVHSRDAVMTKSGQQAMTPDDVFADLRAGNERFVSGNATRRDWLAQAEETAAGQYPKAIVLSCVDSRVTPELIFDQGIGDIFVARVAGNIEDVDQLGGMEFGTRVAGAKVIVVLGHTSCGAVKGAIDRVELGNLTTLLQGIEPAVEAVPVGQGGRTSKDTGYVNRVIEENVRLTVLDITNRSDVLSGLVASGDLKVVGAVYDLSTGKVRWLDSDG